MIPTTYAPCAWCDAPSEVMAEDTCPNAGDICTDCCPCCDGTDASLDRDPLGSCSECGTPAPFDSSHAASWLDAETREVLAATCGKACGDARAARLEAQDRYASCSCERDGRARCAHFLCRGTA